MVKRFVALLAFATIAFLATQVMGQAPAYKSEKLDPALLQKAASAAMTQARREGISKRDMTPQWERFKAFEAYYTRFVFGKLKDEEFLGELGVLTQSLLEDLDRANKSGSPAAGLIRGYIIEMGKQIAPGNYHPAARINATLLLALVDDAPEDPSTKKPPVPAAAAFGPLVGLYMKAENPDGVRAAALQGIARHVSLGAVKTPQYRAGVSKLMMELAKSEPPTGRSPEAHAFMQRYAVDILNVLANPNASPDTTKTLVALSTDKSKPSLIAAYAASRIAVLQPGKATVDKLPEVLQVWAGRAADTVDGELVRITNLDPPVPVLEQPSMPVDEALAANSTAAQNYGSSAGGYESSMMGSAMSAPSSDMSSSSSMGGYDSMMMNPMGMGGMGMGGVPVAALPKPPEVVTSLRRINHLLQQLQLGVTGQAVTGPAPSTKPAGLSAAATPADKVAVDQWVKTIGEVVTAINADTIDDKKKLVEELTKQSAVLRALSGAKPAEGVAGNAVLPGAPALPGMAAAGLDPSGGMQPAAGLPAANMPAGVAPGRNPAAAPGNPVPGNPGAAAPAVAPVGPNGVGPNGVAAPGIAAPGIAAPGIAAPGIAAPAANAGAAAAAPVAPAAAPIAPAAGVQPAAGIPANPADLMNDL